MWERTQGPVFVKPELLRDQRKGWEDAGHSGGEQIWPLSRSYLNGGSELSERSSRQLCGDKDRPCEHWSFVGRPPRVRKPSAHGVYPHPTSAPYFRKCKQPPMCRTEAGGHYSSLTFLSHQLYHPGPDPSFPHQHPIWTLPPDSSPSMLQAQDPSAIAIRSISSLKTS